MNHFFYRLLSSKFGAWLEIQLLTWQTAKAFNVQTTRHFSFSTSKLLKNYAEMTADISLRCIQNEQDALQVHQDLYRMAYRLGSCVRWWLRPQNMQDCLDIITLLYRHIRIQIWEESPGILCVGQCYFSAFYTPEICAMISAIDQGIFAGIYHGGELTFCKRLTSGDAVCMAHFEYDSNINGKDEII